MTRISTAAAVALAAALSASGVAARAHEGHDHKILGTIAMAAADQILVKDRKGKEVTIKVTKDTKVKATPPVDVEDIDAGTRVVVTARLEKDKSWTARIIEVGVRPAEPMRD